jgi:Fic family protein
MSYTEKLKEIDALQQQIAAHGKLSDDVRKRIDYKFRLDWNYYSNSMEGNTLTMEETRSVMVGNVTVDGKPLKDVLEMQGHDTVVLEILKVGMGDARLSEKRIKDIHRGIMHEDDPAKKKKIGIWKPEPNFLYNYKGESFEFVPPVEVPERMHQLLDRTNASIDAIIAKKKDAPHPVDVALRFHLEYVSIHPFYDGNGRTARILTNLLLISLGYPPFWVKTEERDTYGRYLGDIQGYGGKPDLFLAFAADLVLRSQRLVLDAIAGKEIEEPGDLEKKLQLLKQKLNTGTDDIVKTEKSGTVSKQVFDEVLRPLFKTMIARLNQFDSLFKERSVDLEINGGVYRGFDRIIDSPARIYDFTNEVKQMKFTYLLTGFRKAGKEPFNASTFLTIDFHQLVYEGYLQKDKLLFSKLYHQKLSEG